MPFTHVEIEERKTAKLACLFAFLVALYLASVLTLISGSRWFMGLSPRLSGIQWAGALLLACLAAALHWYVSVPRLVDRVLLAVLAKPIDPHDTYHGRLRNLIEEVGVAMGGRRIEPWVISTTALNACSVADFSGRSVIAVTEGLLARLTRQQLETVVGHEAAHIASGDSLSRSVFCGLFSLHEESLKRLSGMFSGREGIDLLRGRTGAFVVFVLVVLWVTTHVKRLCELCVFREQEYRADAVAVRLTRNPLSLAESLHLISTHWRGIGAPGESLSALFIVDSGEEVLSEREGLAAEWFSTHPPTAHRIELLLGMAHTKPDDFERAMADAGRRARRLRRTEAQAPQTPSAGPRRWFLHGADQWLGPFTLDELRAREDFSPDRWVRRDDLSSVQLASQDEDLLTALRLRYGGDPTAQPAAGECPNCRVLLSPRLYEGVPIPTCPACQGCYVTPDIITRVFVRDEQAIAEPIRRLVRSLPAARYRPRIARSFRDLPGNRLKDRQCPSCGSAVIRKFYTEAYLVEVEQCWACGLAWLDRDELELLQGIYEARGVTTGPFHDQMI
jgi:heat shock protein HtpX